MRGAPQTLCVVVVARMSDLTLDLIYLHRRDYTYIRVVRNQQHNDTVRGQSEKVKVKEIRKEISKEKTKTSEQKVR